MKRTTNTIKDRKSGFELEDHRNEKLDMVSFQGAQFAGVDMRDTSLTHVNFVQSKWEHIYFSKVHVKMIQMGGTIFENIVRPDAQTSRLEEEHGTDGWVNVEPVRFVACDLSTSLFENCVMRNVKLNNCDIEGFEIDGIDIKRLIEEYKART